MLIKNEVILKKSGISFLVLLASVIIMLMLLGTVLISYNTISDNSEKLEFAREAYTVEKMVEQYKFMNGRYPLLNEQQIDINAVVASSRSQFSQEPGYATNAMKLKPIDYSEASISNLKRGNQRYGSNDIYLYSETTKKVYYMMGVGIGQNTYYSLTSELMSMISINKVSQ